MPLIYNGSTVKNVLWGQEVVKKVVYGSTTVFENEVTYRYKAKAARLGTDSLELPTAEGVYTINNKACMWCFKDVSDVTGNGVKLSECMQKTIISMKFMAYRSSVAPSSDPTNTAWSYGVGFSNSGMSIIYNRSATKHVDRALPTPSATGVLDQGLTTAELMNIFAAENLVSVSGSSGSGVNLVDAGDYYCFGVRCKYPPSGAVIFRCNNTSYDDAYIEIVAQ